MTHELSQFDNYSRFWFSNYKLSVQNLVFNPNTVEHPAAVFAFISRHGDALERVYIENGFKFYDREQFFPYISRFVLSDDSTKLASFVETGHLSMRLTTPSGLLGQNAGVLTRSICDDDEIIAIGRDVDVAPTCLFLNNDFTESVRSGINIFRRLKQSDDARFDENERWGLIDDRPKSSAAYPDYLLNTSYARTILLTNLYYVDAPEEFQDALRRHFHIFVGCLSLEARFEVYMFVQKNKLALWRIVERLRSKDAFSRTDMSVFSKEVSKITNGHSLTNYLRWCDDIFSLSIVGGESSKTLSGIDFERKCLMLLRESGFDAQLTRASGDFGADIIAQKDGLSYCIQCKHLSRPVGIKAVQEVIAAQKHYLCDYAAIISGTQATQPALQMALSGNVAIINIEGIARLEFLF